MDLVASAVPSLWVMLSSYLIAVPAFVYFMSVSGTGNTGVALRLEMMSIFIYILYIIWIVVVRKAEVLKTAFLVLLFQKKCRKRCF